MLEFSPQQGHGMGLAPEDKDWPSLNYSDLKALQTYYSQLQDSVALIWHSPRPFSSASLVSTAQGEFLIKRSHCSFRSVSDLLQEHSFIQHLAGHDILLAKLIENQQGTTATAIGQWVYEIFERAVGQDIYADLHSWRPFFYPQHAYAAGGMLANLHLAAADFTAAARSTKYLISNQKIIESEAPITALLQRIQSSHVLSSYFAQRPLTEDFLQCFQRRQQPIQTALSQSVKIWTHNDLHASNLIWSEDSAQAQITAVIDFGLSDLTTAAYDVAVSLERNFIDWLDLANTQQLQIDWVGWQQFVQAYAEHSPDIEILELARQILPLVHIDFALYELEYFLAITGNLSHADAAYDYLTEHLHWFDSAAGSQLLGQLKQLIDAERHQ